MAYLKTFGLLFGGMVIAQLLVGVCWLVMDYRAQIAANATWEGKYKQVEQAQKESEEEAKKLREKQKELDTSLQEWRGQLDAIRQQTSATQRQIRGLSNENKDIRDFLRSSVPAELQRVLYPKTTSGHNNSNKNGTSIVSPALDSRIPRAGTPR